MRKGVVEKELNPLYCYKSTENHLVNFQGIFKEMTYIQSKEFREILMTKMRNFDFENGNTAFLVRN